MSSDETVQKAFEIIGEALSLEPEDFQDNETWKFLGLGDLLATATASDLTNETGIEVLPSDFAKYQTVGTFKNFLRAGGETTITDHTVTSNGNSNGNFSTNPTQPSEPSDPWEGVPKPKVPLSVVLQGKPTATTTNVFLFPDGSGAGTSYGTLPPIGSNVCLIGLNSPFLRQAQDFTCSIERMARLWLDEVRKIQPSGPYVLGGWSAGGYYSYEVTKLLVAAGMQVKQLILIDSPCRLEFEALPEQVVAELTRKGLMGASGAKKAPEWLVQHFTSTVLSVDRYMPTPLAKEQVPPKVSFVWVREGLVKSVPKSGLQVDMDVKVTRFLLEPRPELKTVGWEKLLPGAEYSFDYMTGNHFQITQSPHVSSIDCPSTRSAKSIWTY
jgi:thioesterase domain-containing protein